MRITTTKEWEVDNIKKCLLAGYDVVVAIAKDASSIRTMKQKIEQAVNKVSQEKILVLETEKFFFYLDNEIAKEETAEKRVKGYRVKVDY